MKITTSASVSSGVLDAVRDERASAEYLVTLPLAAAQAYAACCARRNVPALLRQKLLNLARTGMADVRTLLSCGQLVSADLIKICNFSSVRAAEATLILAHPNCDNAVIAELAFVEERRAANLKGPRPARMGQVLGVLRNTNTLTRAAAMLMDNDIAASPQEVEAMLNSIINGGPGVLETFLVIVEDWKFNVEDLITTCEDLA